MVGSYQMALDVMRIYQVRSWRTKKETKPTHTTEHTPKAPTSHQAFGLGKQRSGQGGGGRLADDLEIWCAEGLGPYPECTYHIMGSWLATAPSGTDGRTYGCNLNVAAFDYCWPA